MDFTEIYKQSGNLVYFSPGAHFILNAVEDVLIVRRTDTLQISCTWSIGAPSQTATLLNSSKPPSQHQRISHAGWSCDSEYLFAASAKRGIVQVFRLTDEHWNARIETGAEGLVKAEWASDGRHILCFSEWGVSSHLSISIPVFTSSVVPVTGDHMVITHGGGDLHTISNSPRQRCPSNIVQVANGS